MDDEQLYFRQIGAGSMANFIYAIGCKRTKQCMLVDPAWAVEQLLETVENDGMELTGALVTHYHPDHCGGSALGFTVEGLPELMARKPIPVHANEHEIQGLQQVTGLDASDFVKHSDGDLLRVGDVEVRMLHTPGHTPGSQCFLVNEKLVAGDTLFLQGCGRVDLPGGNGEDLQRSLANLNKLDDEIVLYPGHAYSAEPFAPMSTVKRTNPVLQNLDQFLG